MDYESYRKPMLKDHWNQKYASTPTTQLGWYEPESGPSVQYIENCAVSKDSAIVDVGSGASTLIGSLLALGYKNLVAADISAVALEKGKAQLSASQAARVRWLVDDLTQPTALLGLENIAVWHDRAVFHFLTEEKDRLTYRALAQKSVMPGGFLVVATFALNGASQCSGLPVQRYSVEGLASFFGATFTLVEWMDHTYAMPSGDTRPYVYTRFIKM